MTREELQIAYDKLNNFYDSYHHNQPQHKVFSGYRYTTNEDAYLEHLKAGSYINGIIHVLDGRPEPVTEFCYTKEQFFEKIKEFIERNSL